MLLLLPDYRAPAPTFDTTNLALWLRAQDAENASNAPATDGQSVARAVNRGSISGYHAQSNTGRRPTFGANPARLVGPSSGLAYLTSPQLALSSQGQLTFVAVVTTPSGTIPGYTPLIFSRYSGISATGLSFSESGKLGFTWNDSSDTWGWDSGPTIPAATRVFVAASIDGATGNATVYRQALGGSIVSATRSFFASSLTGSQTEWHFGYEGFNDRQLRGDYHEGLVFTALRTQAQIEEIAAALL